MNRLSIAISGGVSLCTYEAGVMSAFHQVFLEHDDIDFEVVSGSSAGAFLFAFAMHKGINPFMTGRIITDETGIENRISNNDKTVLDFKRIQIIYQDLAESNEECGFAFNSSLFQSSFLRRDDIQGYAQQEVCVHFDG